MPTGLEKDVCDLETLIREVRKTFRTLAGLSDQMLERRGLTASLRAILEFVAENGPSTVPVIALAKSMTRQSVQALVDRLQSLGLVEALPNPEHKRSVLIVLTDTGRDAFQAIRTEEKNLLNLISDGWTAGELQRSSETLRRFQERLENLASRQNETGTKTRN